MTSAPCSVDVDHFTLFWAKSDPVAGWHPVLYHMMDVAQTTLALWDTVLPAEIRHRMATALGLSVEAARPWVAFLGGSHDIGKVSPPFAFGKTQDERLHRALLRAGFAPCVDDAPHGLVSAVALKDILRRDFGIPLLVARRFAIIIGAHHGGFPHPQALTNLSPQTSGIGRWDDARRALMGLLASALAVPVDEAPRTLDNATAMWLAGLISVADWIGSNTAYFPYAVPAPRMEPDLAPDVYFQQCGARAQRALDGLGWHGWSPATSQLGFPELFGFTDLAPMQQQVAVLASTLDEPGLLLAEAPMGEGKTEIGLFVADHWGVTLQQRGFYVALPTQTTSNQMFGRVKAFLERRYPADLVHLQLLHGQASLAADFRLLRDAGREVFGVRGVYDDEERASEGAVVAAEWFAHRKRGLLAPFAVGTVDQVLAAALQTKHVFVRLHALAHKTVIVDEIHAYDAYMSTLLERVIEWLAALGSSVVLLSATLPRGKREALIAAYYKGRRQPCPPPEQAAYPRLTWATGTGRGAITVPASPRTRRAVKIRWVDGRIAAHGATPCELVTRLREALAEGGCAAVICNTVGRAQEVYGALRAAFPGMADDGLPEVHLLHARYLYEQREEREQEVLARYSKDGRRPQRSILAATQVIEQSLDVDFDLLVTDLAPIDLLLQRLGRLYRHLRSRRPLGPDAQAWICKVDDVVSREMFGPGSDHVYAPHLLLRSWLALEGLDALRLPEDVERLVEAVYDLDRPCPAGQPDEVQRLWADSYALLCADMEKAVHEATLRYIQHPGYSGDVSDLVRDSFDEEDPTLPARLQMQTRLGDPTISVVFLYRQDGGASCDRDGGRPVAMTTRPDEETTIRLLRRSMPISDRRIVARLIREGVPSPWSRSPFLRYHRLLLLDQDNTVRVGRWRLHLDDELGLVVDESREGGD